MIIIKNCKIILFVRSIIFDTFIEMSLLRQLRANSDAAYYAKNRQLIDLVREAMLSKTKCRWALVEIPDEFRSTCEKIISEYSEFEGIKFTFIEDYDYCKLRRGSFCPYEIMRVRCEW